MFTYTIMNGSNPNYYEDFNVSNHEFNSINDALKDALSLINEDYLKDCARIFVYYKDVDLVLSLNVTRYSLPVLLNKFIT